MPHFAHTLPLINPKQSCRVLQPLKLIPVVGLPTVMSLLLIRNSDRWYGIGQIIIKSHSAGTIDIDDMNGLLNGKIYKQTDDMCFSGIRSDRLAGACSLIDVQ